MTFFSPSVSVSVYSHFNKSGAVHTSGPSSSLLNPNLKLLTCPKSLPVSKMLKLGKLVKAVEKQAQMIHVTDFKLSDMEWGKGSDMSYYIDESPFTNGEFRKAYKAKRHRLEGATVFVVKKYLQKTFDELELVGDTPEEHAKKLVQMHSLAQNFASQLKMLLQSKEYKGNCLSYNNVSYGTLNNEPVTIEEFIDGDFVKYVNNDGSICQNRDGEAQTMAQCLVHFSFVKSNGTLILVDIQGCGFKLCDPEIATTAGSFDESNKLLFCSGNLSTVAKETFFAQHTCNKYCLLAELPPHNL